jgi:hypothetical protein
MAENIATTLHADVKAGIISAINIDTIRDRCWRVLGSRDSHWEDLVNMVTRKVVGDCLKRKGVEFLGATTRMKSCPCTNCGKMQNAATGVNEDCAPSPGDCSICLDCGHLMVFADDLKLRNPTDAEMHEMAGDSRIVEMQRMRALVVPNKGAAK